MSSTESVRDDVIAAQSGNEAAFEHLYYYSLPIVRSNCRKILKSSEDVEDAIQETYIQVYRKINTLGDPDKFLSWVTTIATNKAKEVLRRKMAKTGKDDYKAEFSEDDFEGFEKLSTDQFTPDEAPDRQVEQNDLTEALLAILDGLPDNQRSCYLLWAEGYSTREIGEKLLLKDGTVKSNIHYAKNKIRKEIQVLERENHIDLYNVTYIPTENGVTVLYESSTTGEGNASAEIGKGGASASGAVKLATWKKITIGIAGAAVVGAAVYGTISLTRNNNSETDVSQTVSVSVEVSTEDRTGDEETTSERQTEEANTTQAATTSTTRATTAATTRQQSTTRRTTTTRQATTGDEISGSYDGEY